MANDASSQVAGGAGGMHLELQHALYMCPELLFEGRAGLGGMVSAAIETASRGQSQLRAELLGAIVLNGGSSQFPGLAQRLQHEVRRMLPSECDPAGVGVFRGCGDKTAWRGAMRLALATPQIYNANSTPQSLLLQQCAARGCTVDDSGGAMKVRVTSGCPCTELE